MLSAWTQQTQLGMVTKKMASRRPAACLVGPKAYQKSPGLGMLLLGADEPAEQMGRYERTCPCGMI